MSWYYPLEFKWVVFTVWVTAATCFFGYLMGGSARTIFVVLVWVGFVAFSAVMFDRME
jgi:hypothetical protein